MIGKVVWKYEGGIVMGLRRVVCDRRFGSVLEGGGRQVVYGSQGDQL